MKKNTVLLVRAALMTALAIILMQPVFEIPLAFLAPWLKMDLSSVPVLIAGFGLGPIWGLAVQVVKSIVHIPFGSAGGIGELADLVVGSALVLPAAFIYKQRKTKPAAIIGLAVGIVSMMVMAYIANRYFLLRLLLGADYAEKLGFIAGDNTKISSVDGYLLYAVLPFNLLKGVIVSLLSFILFNSLKRIVSVGEIKK